MCVNIKMYVGLFGYLFVWPDYFSGLLDRLAHDFCEVILIFPKRVITPKIRGFIKS